MMPSVLSDSISNSFLNATDIDFTITINQTFYFNRLDVNPDSIYFETLKINENDLKSVTVNLTYAGQDWTDIDLLALFDSSPIEAVLDTRQNTTDALANFTILFGILAGIFVVFLLIRALLNGDMDVNEVMTAFMILVITGIAFAIMYGLLEVIP